MPFLGTAGSVRRMGDSSATPDVLAEVGPRLRRLRERRGVTLTALAAKTGISKSTLSRLESGQRKPSLELLLPLAETYHLPLDELVGAPPVGDPRVRARPRTRNGRLVFHWFGPAGDQPVEILSVHGSQGQRMHVRAAPRRKAAGG